MQSSLHIINAPDDSIICPHCGVSKKDILLSVSKGLYTVREIREDIGACKEGCPQCSYAIPLLMMRYGSQTAPVYSQLGAI